MAKRKHPDSIQEFIDQYIKAMAENIDRLMMAEVEDREDELKREAERKEREK